MKTNTVDQIQQAPVRAWRVVCDDVVSITFARNRSAAKYNMLNAARDAGFYQRGRDFPSALQARRAPQYDASHLRVGSGRRCWDEDFLRTA